VSSLVLGGIEMQGAGASGSNPRAEQGSSNAQARLLVVTRLYGLR
jgi:hypothetical protein